MYQLGLTVFSEEINNMTDVQDELLLSTNPNADRIARNQTNEKA